MTYQEWLATQQKSEAQASMYNPDGSVNYEAIGLSSPTVNDKAFYGLSNPGDTLGNGNYTNATNSTLQTDPEVDTNKPTDWGMDGYGGVALGAGQLGLGVMSYLENSKTADKQRALMDQQITNNKFALGNAKAYKEAVNKTFGDRVSLNKTSDSKGA
jgi:hypothetical protein